ncbi:Protein N-terminal glutamine amidohydrolase [Podochytrium sp. JEL0797]|nr:Protein N-terminal glutamine amidohydrolase [Podochytrium sp. JEL0797]
MHKTAFTHTPCYCEENVLLLLKRITAQNDSQEAFCVFVSNQTKSIPIWHQTRGNPVVWDYHVIAVVRMPERTFVLDLDSTLPFPTPFDVYVNNALPILESSPTNDLSRFNRYYRVVKSSEFIKTFASDRRHMQKDGEWMAPPPSYPGFESPGCFFNLDKYWTMGEEFVGVADCGDGFGEVFDERGFRQRFGSEAFTTWSL